MVQITLTNTGKTIIITIFDPDNFFALKERKNGNTSPGTMIDPRTYQSFTTDGILKARPKAIRAVTTSPFRTSPLEAFVHGF